MAAKTITLTFPGTRILEQTPSILKSLLATASPEDFDWQPAPDRWSVSMVLAHLADVEGKAFVSRFRAIAEQDNPLLPAYDQLALFRSSEKFDGPAKLNEFARLRQETVTWLSSLPASVGGRSGRHEELGVLRFEQLLNEFAFHDLGHVRQIIELYRAHAFYPRMGMFQNYYKVSP